MTQLRRAAQTFLMTIGGLAILGGGGVLVVRTCTPSTENVPTVQSPAVSC